MLVLYIAEIYRLEATFLLLTVILSSRLLNYWALENTICV